MTIRRLLRRLLKGIAIVALLVILGIGALFAYVWLEHRTTASLPVPTGPLAVGRAILDWTDSLTPDTLAPVAGAKRELLVWIWYPAAAAPSAVTDDYLPRALRPKAKDTGGDNIWTLLTKDASTIRGHSIRDASLSPRSRSYPVLVFRAGASSGVLNYSSLIEDLASHGYVVVGFDAPYRTGRVIFPDGRVMFRTEKNNPESCVVPDRARMEQCVGRVLAAWSGDIAFVLDRLARLNASDSSGRFTGRLDMTRVGVFGHSLGGATAAWFCQEDARCKAGIDIDGAPHGSVIQAGLRQPFMFLMSDHSHETDPASNQIRADIQSLYDRVPPDRRVSVTIRGSFHYMFSDDGAVMKSGVVRGLLRLFGRLHMSGRRQLAVTGYAVRTFFDAYLKGDGASPPSIASPLYPELQVDQVGLPAQRARHPRDPLPPTTKSAGSEQQLTVVPTDGKLTHRISPHLSRR